jgi:hypothetical protein
MGTPTYCYRELETERTIRLITICPGSVDDNVQLGIQHRHLDDDATAFEALSYVWGNPNPRKQIFINNIPFEVGPSLYSALHHLRHHNEKRVMWIDAVAINQEDLHEKSVQVPLMRFIYPLAAATVVFIGEADEDTSWAFNCFEMLHALYCFWYETPKAATQRGLRSRVIGYDLKRLFRFMSRDWFARAWTFQEICLSTEVQVICGEHSIPWTTIVFAIAAVRLGSDGTGLTGVEDRALTRIEYWALLHFIGKSSAPLQFSMTTLLSETKGLATTDSRDRIYSLMAMAEMGRFVFQPDYTLSVSATYILATRCLIKDDNGLRVFQQLDKPKKSNDLPSWVPDWRQNQRGVPLVPSKVPSWLPEKSRKTTSNAVFQGTFYNFNASHTVDFTDRPISDKPKLTLTGSCVDIIEAVYPTSVLLRRLLRSNNGATTWRIVFAVIRKFFDTIKLLDDSEAFSDIDILRVLCADHLPISKQRRTSHDMIPEQSGHYKRNTGLALFRSNTFLLDAEWIKHEYLSMWNEVYQDPDVPTKLNTIATKALHVTKMVVGIRPSEEENAKRDRIAREYCSVVCGILDGRAFITTHGGRIGVAPEECKSGDQIFSLVGGNLPYILRPTAKVPEYRILGETYVHGVMDGELWNSEGTGSVPTGGGNEEFSDVVLV